MRYLIKFSYDGTNFHGFESQPNYRTIEDELNKALAYINNGIDTKLVASGRTDKGVHALGQIAHVDITVSITKEKLKRALNSLLPNDIHVIEVKSVANDFHARYMAKEKIYQYKLNMGEYNPIQRNYVYQFSHELDVLKMNKAIKYFIGKHDFRAFTETKEKRNNYEREIIEATIEEDSDILTFTFRGTGFIKYQVRNMVGLLIQIGLGKMDIEMVPKIIEGKTRSVGYRTAHPEGLYLVKVIYKKDVK